MRLGDASANTDGLHDCSLLLERLQRSTSRRNGRIWQKERRSPIYPPMNLSNSVRKICGKHSDLIYSLLWNLPPPTAEPTPSTERPVQSASVRKHTWLHWSWTLQERTDWSSAGARGNFKRSRHELAFFNTSLSTVPFPKPMASESKYDRCRNSCGEEGTRLNVTAK